MHHDVSLDQSGRRMVSLTLSSIEQDEEKQTDMCVETVYIVVKDQSIYLKKKLNVPDKDNKRQQDSNALISNSQL